MREIFPFCLFSILGLIAGCSGGSSEIDAGYLSEGSFFIIESPADGTLYSGSLTPEIIVRGTCSLSNTEYRVQLNGADFLFGECNGLIFEFLVDRVLLIEGANQLVLRTVGPLGIELPLTLNYDSILPVVSLNSPPTVTSINQGSYTVSGSCSEPSVISVIIGGTAVSTSCSTTWSTTVDVSGVLDSSSVSVVIDIEDESGNQGLQLSTAVLKDTVLPIITIASPSGISAANVLTYSFSGFCSEEGTAIAITVGNLSRSANCVANTYTSGPVDVSGLADGLVMLSVSTNDSLGNTGQALVTVSKDTSVPTVRIISPVSDINQFNQFSFTVTGECSENGQDVVISIGGVGITLQCSSGSWSTGPRDLSGLAEGSVSMTADHDNLGGDSAVQATLAIQKNTTAASVSVTSAPAINANNETIYALSGNCSENGVPVAIDLEGMLFSPNCSSGTWTTGQQDISSLADGPLALTVDHDSAPQITREILKATSTPTVSNLSVPSTLPNSASLAWDLNGSTGFVINDYLIDYRTQGSSTWLRFNDGISVSRSTTINTLLPGTSYEFRVAVVYDTSNTSAFSNMVIGLTQPDSPIFGINKAMNVGGATQSAVVAYEDSTAITLNGAALTTLNKGQSHVFNSVQFDIIDANKPIFTAGRRGGPGGSSGGKGNMVWSPSTWAGKIFSLNAIRANAQRIEVYAIENSNVTVKQGNTVLASATLAAGNGTTLSWSVYGSYQLISTGAILAFHYSSGGGFADPKPLIPASLEIIGIPSTSMRLTANFNGTNFSYLHSNSVIGSNSLNRQDSITLNPQGTSSQYQSRSLLISADKEISGASFADSNGYCAAPFLPTNLMKTRYAINVQSDWVAFASKTAGTIEVLDSSDTVLQTLTLIRSGGNSSAPFVARRTVSDAGTRFVSTVPVAAWYQPRTTNGASNEDETILYGTD